MNKKNKSCNLLLPIRKIYVTMGGVITLAISSKHVKQSQNRYETRSVLRSLYPALAQPNGIRGVQLFKNFKFDGKRA